MLGVVSQFGPRLPLHLPGRTTLLLLPPRGAGVWDMFGPSITMVLQLPGASLRTQGERGSVVPWREP